MYLFDQLPHVDISAQSTIRDDSSDGGIDMECVDALASTCDVLNSTFHIASELCTTMYEVLMLR